MCFALRHRLHICVAASRSFPSEQANGYIVTGVDQTGFGYGPIPPCRMSSFALLSAMRCRN